MSGNRFSRRHFFYGSLLAGAVPAGGFGQVPSLSRMGYKSPNEKLNIGVIGCGTRSVEILWGVAPTENVVALCDVNEERAARTFGDFPNATTYNDYRRMLEAEQNLDGVMIATPDHWHTPMALAAMEHGKHVYCEKPLTRTAYEARLLNDAAAKYGVATQMGNQGWNHEATKTACEIVWSGEIGDVTELHTWTGGIYGGYPDIPATGPESTPVPSSLDWDLWLGPAAPRDYNPLMVSNWRAFLDFSMGGQLGDWQVHMLGPAHLALQLDKVSPTSVECVYVERPSDYVWPFRSHLVYEFPARGNMPPVSIHSYQNMRGDFQNPEGMGEEDRLFPGNDNLAEKGRPYPSGGDGNLLMPDRLAVDGTVLPQAGRGQPPAGAGRGAARGQAPAAAVAAGAAGARGGGGFGGRGQDTTTDPTMRSPGNGTVFVGSRGYMATRARGEGVWLLPASRWADYKLPPQVLPRGINHQQDWLRACKGGVPGVSQFSVATKYIEWLALGAIALRVPGQKLLWDPGYMRFTNSAEANRHLVPFMREGFEYSL